MINVAIVDDEKDIRDNLIDCFSFVSKELNLEFNITQFESGLSFLEDYKSAYDIVLMDIDMPGIDGMETARQLRKVDPVVVLIFVTNMAQYAISGYEVDALDFILKPVNKYSFGIKLKRAISRIPSKNDDFITIKLEKEIIKIKISSIKFLEVNKHYVIFHTNEGDYMEYTTLKDATLRINKDYFILANRSFLINPNYVTAVSKDTVTIGTIKIDISRPQRKTFLSAMSKYLGGGI